MLWLAASAVLLWCALRELRDSSSGYSLPLSRAYLAITIALAMLCACQPVSFWRFERFLSSKATQLAGKRRTTRTNARRAERSTNISRNRPGKRIFLTPSLDRLPSIAASRQDM